MDEETETMIKEWQEHYSEEMLLCDLIDYSGQSQTLEGDFTKEDEINDFKALETHFRSNGIQKLEQGC